MLRSLTSKPFAFVCLLGLTLLLSCGTGQISTNKADRQRDKARALRHGCCFTAETLIRMADGTEKPIGNLHIGDEIMSFNLLAGRPEPATVMGVVAIEHNNLVEYRFDRLSIRATQDHPFFIQGKGWASLDPAETTRYFNFRNKGISEIENGDAFFHINDKGIVSPNTLREIKPIDGVFETFSIVKLSNNDSFFANGTLTGVEEIATQVVAIP